MDILCVAGIVQQAEQPIYLAEGLEADNPIGTFETSTNLSHTCKEKKRKVYAGHRLRAFRKGPLNSKLAKTSPRVPQNYIS
eukprot:183880-Pelagomonas_calceolata.AAC.1